MDMELNCLSPNSSNEKSKRKILMKKCVVPMCNTKSISGFAKSPNDPIIRDAWQNLFGIKELKKRDRICHKHFQDSDFLKTGKKSWLMNEALPSLHLPIFDEKLKMDTTEKLETSERKSKVFDSDQEDKVEPIITDKDVETIIKKEYFDTNPWLVDNIAVLLKYCCPECDYNDSDLKVFSNHALENHERSSTLINDINKMMPRNSSEVQVYLNLKPSNFETDIESQHDHALKETVKEEVFEDYENTEENYEYDRDNYNDNDDAGSDPDFDTKDIKKVEIKKPKKVKKKPKTTTKQLLFKKDEKSLNFECDQCEKKFATMQGLKMHTTNSHDQVCELCSEEFSSTKEMQVHLKEKHPDCGDKNYKCTLCMKYFFLESSLENHKADHKCVCDLCGQELANHKSLERHMVIQHPTQDATDLVCEICAYSTPSKDKLRAHKFAKHEVEKHKQCPLCDFKSPTKQKLNMHVDRHHPEHADKQFFCEFCGKGFIYKATLNHHTTYDCKNFTSAKKVHKKIIEKQWKEKNKSKVSIKCDYCEEVLPSTKRVKTHYQNWHPNLPIIAEDVKKYKCYQCIDFFFLQEELDCHLNLQHGVKTDKNYCKRCENSYKDVHRCFADVRYIQKKKDKVQCPHCDKQFSGTPNMRAHIKAAHEKIFDFECDQCGKKLATMKRLKSHITQSHNQVACELCHKKVATGTDLKRHKVFVHNITKGAWLCERCPKTVFFMKSMYDKHMMNKH